MKILIIDSHKGSSKPPQNLHWLNAFEIKNFLQSQGHIVDLIWSYPTVNDVIITGYDKIIFNHASHYSYVDYKWVESNQQADLYYITNEYNLGEPRALWIAARNGRYYTVIANHDSKISKVVTKYVKKWEIANLNTLVYSPAVYKNFAKTGCVYYGSFRKHRSESFTKYLTSGSITISTHKKNRAKFGSLGITGPFINRINWVDGLAQYKGSLYIEDEITHTNYNFLANRFYEALNYDVVPLFDEKCQNTLNLSLYGAVLGDRFIVANPNNVHEKLSNVDNLDYDVLNLCKKIATQEKIDTLLTIQGIITK